VLGLVKTKITPKQQLRSFCGVSNKVKTRSLVYGTIFLLLIVAVVFLVQWAVIAGAATALIAVVGIGICLFNPFRGIDEEDDDDDDEDNDD
jgi:hypothetical protein